MENDIENFDHKLDIVAEGVTMVNEKLDREVSGLKAILGKHEIPI